MWARRSIGWECARRLCQGLSRAVRQTVWSQSHPGSAMSSPGPARQGAALASRLLSASHWGLGADVLTDIFAPEASVDTRSALAAYQRHASSAETAANLLELCYHIDVTDFLGQVTVPTLVMHREHDRAAPLEQARLIASRIRREGHAGDHRARAGWGHVSIPPRGARLITRRHCVPAVTRSGRGWETPGSRTGSRWRSFPVSTRTSR
jgi:pimeloyl-ACP methyl ester carboxylesterase